MLRRLQSDFAPAVRDRGRGYFASGRVTLGKNDAKQISATVRGSRRYAVKLIRIGGTIEDYECSCPYAEDNWTCKHIWAALLAADEAGWLDPLDAEEPFDAPEDRDGRGAPKHASSSAHAGRQRTARRAPAPPPEWKLRLQRARLAAEQAAAVAQTAPRSPALAAGRRIIYVVDLAATVFEQQGLVIELFSEKVDRDGSAALKQLRVARDRLLEAPDAADREIAQLLLGARAELAFSHGDSTVHRFVLPDASIPIALRRICETGRCRLGMSIGDAGMSAPLTWDPGEPWQLVLAIEAAPAKADRFRIAARLERAGERMDLAEAQCLLTSGWVIARDRIARMIDGGGGMVAVELRADGELEIGRDAAGEMLAELSSFPALPRLELTPSLGITGHRATPRPVADFGAYTPYGWRSRTIVRVSFDYDGVVVAADRRERALFDRGSSRIIHRDADAESKAIARVMALGARFEYDFARQTKVMHVPSSRAAALRQALAAEGWRIAHEGRPERTATTIDTEVRSSIDWFDLEGFADFEGVRLAVAELVAALSRGDDTVTLPDGSIGMIPPEWRRRFGMLAGMGTPANGALRFARTQAGVLDALLAALPEPRVDETFARVRRELTRFEGVTPLDPPSGFAGELRPYQREGLGWLEFLCRFGFGGCLADDMGLGKTVQALAQLARRREEGAGPSLVVVPKSLVSNWEREAARFAPSLRVLAHHGTQRRRDMSAGDVDLIITTYGTLRRDITALGDIEFDYAILDEAQAIKNATTQTAKAVRLIRARHRLAMTGTPVENRLSELWSLFEFLHPGMLGAAAVFTRAMKSLGTAGAEGDEARALLGRALRPFILRRTKAQVAPELPERLEQTIVVDLEPAQRKLYDRLRDQYRASVLGLVDRQGLARSKMHILEALLRLRQAACHPALIDPSHRAEPAAKLDVLLERLAEVTAEWHKTLVFSQFTSLLALVRERLDAAGVAYAYLDGKTRARAAQVDRFQSDPACPLFLISLKAGGLGLNLTAAEYVYLLDPWWNPAVEAQAIDRAHRIGQTRRVIAARLIARDTVEEKILELQATKRALADAIVGEDNAVLATLGREELELLLG